MSNNHTISLQEKFEANGPAGIAFRGNVVWTGSRKVRIAVYAMNPEFFTPVEAPAAQPAVQAVPPVAEVQVYETRQTQKSADLLAAERAVREAVGDAEPMPGYQPLDGSF